MSNVEYRFFGRGLKSADYSQLYDEGYYQVFSDFNEGFGVLSLFDLDGELVSPEHLPAFKEYRLKISPVIEKYRLAALDIFWVNYWGPHTFWEKLRDRLGGGDQWIWKHPDLRAQPVLEAAAAAGRVAQALESHDSGIEPLFDKFCRYDQMPPENYGREDDYKDPREKFVWVFREIKRTCEALAGCGADIVTVVELHH